MAQVKLKIEVNPNAETEKIGDITNKVNDLGSTSNLSNVSIKAKDNGMFIVNEMSDGGRELLSFGESGSLKFTQDGYLSSNGVTKGELASEQNPDMFVWGVVPSNKQYSVKLTFTNAQNLKDIVVYGDKVSNQFPIEAIIDNKKVIYSNDYRWAINLGVESDTHTIEFTKWNRGDYNACLTLIRVMLRYFEISNGSGLIELESLSQSNSQPKEIYYGVIPNTGSASVNDNYGEINDLINEEIITNSMNNIEIYIDNKKIQHHITTDSDYEDGKVFTMDFENSLSFLETKYAGRNLTDSMSAYALLAEVLSTLNFNNEQIDSMLDEDIIYGDGETGSVKSYLEKITIEYPYLETSTYRETLNKFCTLAQLNLLEDDNGNLKFVSARPIDVESKPIIVIPTNRQFSRLVKDEFLKNKYSNPFVQYCEFIGEESLFGETKTANFREDNGKTHIIEQPAGYEALVFSDYDEIYNNSQKNPMINVTSVVNYTFGEGNNQSTLPYYKVHVILPISNENILKDLDNIFISISGDKAGIETTTYTTTMGEVGKEETITHSGNHCPYKTTNYSIMLELKDGEKITTGYANTHILNVVKTKTKVEFDILFWKDVIDISGSLIDYVLYVLNSTFQLYGEVYRYNFVENEGQSDLEISGNELIQKGTLYNNSIKIYELNKNNIIVDYTKGIRTANISVACLDYYDTKGNKVVDWSKQEILKVGQIVRIDKDNLGNSKVNYINGQPYLWKIVGRKFRYNGIAMLDLELQEVKFNTYYLINETIGNYASVKYTRISSEYGGSIGEITSKDILYPNDVIKIETTFQENDIYTMGDIYVNGQKFTSGDYITINQPLVVNVQTNLKIFKITSNIGNGATLVLTRESSPNGKASIGKVDVNGNFYYGDVLVIDWNLSGSYEVRDAYFNDTRLYAASTNRVTITKDSTINIPTIKYGWETIWEGEFQYNMLENDGITNEIIINLDQYGERGISIDTSVDLSKTKFYYEYLEATFGEDLNNIYNLVGSGGIYDFSLPLSERISGDMTSLSGIQDPPPYMNIELYNTGDKFTTYIKVNRTIGNIKIDGSSKNYNSIFSRFKLVKIEQYISN